MSVSYDYYRIFYYVATYKSINRAASVLSNSQPNISRAVANLEAQLGCKLFNRSSTGVTLTEAGEELFSHVEAAYRHLFAGEEIIRSEVQSHSTVLSIGISVDLTRRTLQEMIAYAIGILHEGHPEIKISICHAAPTTLISDVSEGLLDMAFITTTDSEIKNRKHYEKKIIHSYRDVVIAGGDFEMLKGRTVSIAEISRYPLICLGLGSEAYQCYSEMFAEHGIEFRPSIETVSMEQILSYSIANLGIGFSHPKDAEGALEDGSIFKVKVKEKMPQKYVAMIRNEQDRKALNLFEQVLNDQLRKRAGHSAK